MGKGQRVDGAVGLDVGGFRFGLSMSILHGVKEEGRASYKLGIDVDGKDISISGGGDGILGMTSEPLQRQQNLLTPTLRKVNHGR